LFSPIPVEKVEGEKNDEDKKNADGPEEALHKGVAVFLGVKEDPEGHDERNDVNEDKKEAHPGISPKTAFSYQPSAVSDKNSLEDKLNADS
jgi:hypothetical protein